MKILVVDDEKDICEILQSVLETEGYEVETANSAEEALALISNTVRNSSNGLSTINLILLDVMMGEMSGFQMARRLKDNPLTAKIPIIFLTALDGEDDTVKGLNIGADDYIAKPFSLKEVKARVAAVLRRTSRESVTEFKTAKHDANIVVYEGIYLDLESKMASVDGDDIPLTKLEFELLTLFLQHPGKVFSREDLLHRCWPQDVYVLDRTVDVNITRLRKKLGQYGKLIKTRVGYGYSFS